MFAQGRWVIDADQTRKTTPEYICRNADGPTVQAQSATSSAEECRIFRHRDARLPWFLSERAAPDSSSCRRGRQWTQFRDQPQNVGVTVKDSVLPLSSTPLGLPPLWLRP